MVGRRGGDRAQSGACQRPRDCVARPPRPAMDASQPAIEGSTAG